MKVISTPVSKNMILEKYNNFFNKMIKAVVDTEKKIISLDSELHADLEESLLKKGAKQENLWGINLYLDNKKDKQIEYTALLNIRPSLNNKSMEVEDLEIKNKIKQIVEKLIVE